MRKGADDGTVLVLFTLAFEVHTDDARGGFWMCSGSVVIYLLVKGSREEKRDRVVVD